MPFDRTTPGWRRLGIAVVALVSLGVGTYSVRRALALGIPSAPTLSYTGRLLSYGAPDNSTHSMSAALFVSGTAQCTTATTSITCVNGQFTIPLTDTCVAVVQANPNVQVQVTVDGTSMGLTTLGAVPYAVVADNATGNLTPQSVSVNGSSVQLNAAGVTIGPNALDKVTPATWETLTGGSTSVADNLHTHVGLTHAWVQIGTLSQIWKFRGKQEQGVTTVGVSGVTYPPLQYEYGITYNNLDPIAIVLSDWDGGARAMFVHPYVTGDTTFQPGGWFGTVNTPFNEGCGKSAAGDQLWYNHYWYGFSNTQFTSGNGCTSDPNLYVRLR